MIQIDSYLYVDMKKVSAIYWDIEKKRTFIYTDNGYVSTEKPLCEVIETIRNENSKDE